MTANKSIRTYSLGNNVIDWLDKSAQVAQLSSSAYLNQILLHAMGEVSIIPNTNQKNSLQEKVSHDYAVMVKEQEVKSQEQAEKDKKIQALRQTKKEHRQDFLEACKRMPKYDDPTVYCDIARKLWKIPDMHPQEVMDYLTYGVTEERYGKSKEKQNDEHSDTTEQSD